MYIPHIGGTPFPAIPMPHQIWPAQARIPAVRMRGTTPIHEKERVPGGSGGPPTARGASADVGGVARAALLIAGGEASSGPPGPRATLPRYATPARAPPPP